MFVCSCTIYIFNYSIRVLLHVINLKKSFGINSILNVTETFMMQLTHMFDQKINAREIHHKLVFS